MCIPPCPIAVMLYHLMMLAVGVPNKIDGVCLLICVYNITRIKLTCVYYPHQIFTTLLILLIDIYFELHNRILFEVVSSFIASLADFKTLLSLQINIYEVVSSFIASLDDSGKFVLIFPLIKFCMCPVFQPSMRNIKVNHAPNQGQVYHS